MNANDENSALTIARAKAGIVQPATFGRERERITGPEHLGRLVAERRKQMKLTQQDFADLAGVGRRFVSELEAGKPTVELGKVLLVLQALGMDLLASRRS